jgi:hypothetical protein
VQACILGHAKLIWGFQSATDPKFEIFRNFYYNILNSQQKIASEDSLILQIVEMIFVDIEETMESKIVLAQI